MADRLGNMQLHARGPVAQASHLSLGLGSGNHCQPSIHLPCLRPTCGVSGSGSCGFDPSTALPPAPRLFGLFWGLQPSGDRVRAGSLCCWVWAGGSLSHQPKLQGL